MVRRGMQRPETAMVEVVARGLQGEGSGQEWGGAPGKPGREGRGESRGSKVGP